jgi:hypothetical protein
MTAPTLCRRDACSVAAEDGTGQPPSPQPRLRRKEAARYLADVWGIPSSPKTLAKQAVTGGGPPFRKAGRVPLYEITELDEFARRRLGPSWLPPVNTVRVAVRQCSPNDSTINTTEERR